MLARRVMVLVMAVVVLGIVLTFWARSHMGSDMVCWRRSPKQRDVISVNGILAISGGEIVSKFPAKEGWDVSFWPFERRADIIRTIHWDSVWQGTYAGFLYERSNRRSTGSIQDTVSVRIPYWSMALVAGGVVALSLRPVVRIRGRMKRGECPQCGYDLRATPDRCPECGARGR